MKITICDDSEDDIARLTSALFAYDPFFEIKTFTSGTALIDEIKEDGCYIEILFMDIYMPDIDGITTAQEIAACCRDIKIIFLSSSSDHYSQAYDLFAFNYILKPFDKEKLYTVLDRAIAETQIKNENKIVIQYKSTVHSVDCLEILYIESRDRLLYYYLADGRVLQCYGKLEKVLQELPEKTFLRCHQSFIVNLFHVTEMSDTNFRLKEFVISISRKYLKAVKDQYYTYLFSLMNGGQQL